MQGRAQKIDQAALPVAKNYIKAVCGEATG
jgi:hypothetical protein